MVKQIDLFEKYITLEHTFHGPMRIECAYLIGTVIKSVNGLPNDGDIMEIGVLNGRSALAAACFLHNDEVFYAVDPFETYDDNPVLKFGGVGSQKTFFNNWIKLFGNKEKLKLFTMDSEAFIKKKLKSSSELNKKFKYISVDGDHSYEGTLIDLEFAAQFINDTGVIAIDDVFNNEWPTVSQALNHFLSNNKKYVPFCSGWGRLFLCRKEVVKDIQFMTKRNFDLFKKRIGPNFRILKSFNYYGTNIDIYTNRWGSASRIELSQKAYKVGCFYQQIESKYPLFRKIIDKIIF